MPMLAFGLLIVGGSTVGAGAIAVAVDLATQDAQPRRREQLIACAAIVVFAVDAAAIGVMGVLASFGVAV